MVLFLNVFFGAKWAPSVNMGIGEKSHGFSIQPSEFPFIFLTFALTPHELITKTPFNHHLSKRFTNVLTLLPTKAVTHYFNDTLCTPDRFNRTFSPKLNLHSPNFLKKKRKKKKKKTIKVAVQW